MIYALHGIIDKLSATNMGHRNLVQTDILRSYLIVNRNIIGTTTEVIAKKKEIAFTIDDSTNASFEAAVLFAELNIPCIWFVNGSNIVENRPYSFAYLNELMNRCGNSIMFNDRTINSDCFLAKKRIRKDIKEFMHLNLPSEELRLNFLNKMIENNHIHNFEIPEYAKQITLKEMVSLNGSSVRVMNHLWEHNFTDLVEIEILKENIMKGKNWLQTYLDYPINELALPYGLYSESLRNLTSDTIYLLDNNYDIGEVIPNVINRIAF